MYSGLSARPRHRRDAKDEEEPDHDHREREHLPHGEAGHDEAEERIGLAEYLADDPGDAVTDEEEPGDGARPPGQPPHMHSDRQDREQKDALEDRLVELARVARLRPAVREHHRPGNIAGPAVQLAVDEICDTAQKEADRHLRADRIGDGEQVDFHNAGVEDHDNQHPKEPAVKGHAPLPDHQNFSRIGEVIARLIEQHVAKPAAHDDAEGAPHHQVVRVALGQPVDARFSAR